MRRWRAGLLVNGALAGRRRCSRCCRCCGCCRSRSCRPGRPARFRRRCCPSRADARELPRAVRASRHGPLLRQQPGRRGGGHARARCVFNVGRRLCVRQAALRRPRPDLPAAARRAGDPGASGDDARCSCCSRSLGLVNTYGGVHRPGAGQHLRHLPGAPVCAVDSRRDAGGGAHRRRERVPDLPLRSSCPCCGRSSITLAVFTSSAPGTTSCGR